MRSGIFAFAVVGLAMAAVTTGGLIGGISKAEARPFWEESDQSQRVTSNKRRYKKTARTSRSSRNERRSSRRSASRSGVGGRPSRWCGWWMRTQLGGGPEFNLAANWRRYGRPAGGPQVGAVVVWPHHVGMITGRASNGQWIVKSGNDGGRVRERARSVSGAVFRIG